jgi:hypothetical protein
MERSGTGLNWRSQVPKPADVSLWNLEGQAHGRENLTRRNLRQLSGGRGWGGGLSNSVLWTFQHSEIQEFFCQMQ